MRRRRQLVGGLLGDARPGGAVGRDGAEAQHDRSARARATRACRRTIARHERSHRWCAARYSAIHADTRSMRPRRRQLLDVLLRLARRRRELRLQRRRHRQRLQPLPREQPAQERLVHLPRRLLHAHLQLGRRALDRLLIVVRQRVPRAPRQQHAAGQVADAQIDDVARLRRPLERQRRRRQPDEAVDLAVVVGARRAFDRQRHDVDAHRRELRPQDLVEAPQPRRAVLRTSAMVRIGVREKRTREAHARRRHVDVAGLGELLVDDRLEAPHDVVRLVAIAELADHAGGAHRRRQPLAEHAAREDAVELIALHALVRLQLVAGDARQVPLDLHVVVRRRRDLARRTP